MHYRNGREAHHGDPVIGENCGAVVAGTLHSLQAAAESCNAQIAYPIAGGCANAWVTVGKILHAQDAWNACATAPGMAGTGTAIPPIHA